MSETAQFPGVVATKLYQVEARTTTYLTNDIDNSQLNIEADTTGFPAKGFITIESETNEYLSLTALQFNVVSPRAYAGTAVSHLAGKAIKLSVAAATMNRVIAEVVAIETALGANMSGWVEDTATFAYVSAVNMSRSGGNAASIYQKGDKLRWKQGAGYKYGYVIDPPDNTSLNLTGGTDYTVANAAITNVAYSHTANPLGFPDWFNWTPTYSAGGSMTIGGVTTLISKFYVKGQTVTMSIGFYGTTGGTAHNEIHFTIPVLSTGAFAGGGGAVVQIVDNSTFLAGWCTPGDLSKHKVQKIDGTNFSLAATTGMAYGGQISYQMV